MNVGLVDVDSLAYNVALMKLSAIHKAAGDEVEIAFPLRAESYDLVYRSKLFDFTPDDPTYWPCEVISGGTGYDLSVRLPAGADTVYPDYGLYGCEHAIGRITRGCPRSCDFCLVGAMDGTRVHQVAQLEDFWRGQDRVRLLDDNLTAMPELFIQTCDQLAGLKVRFGRASCRERV